MAQRGPKEELCTDWAEPEKRPRRSGRQAGLMAGAGSLTAGRGLTQAGPQVGRGWRARVAILPPPPRPAAEFLETGQRPGPRPRERRGAGAGPNVPSSPDPGKDVGFRSE